MPSISVSGSRNDNLPVIAGMIGIAAVSSMVLYLMFNPDDGVKFSNETAKPQINQRGQHSEKAPVQAAAKAPAPVSVQNADKGAEKDVPKQNIIPPGFNYYNFNYKYRVSVKGSVKDMEIAISIPLKENRKQHITNLALNPKPQKLIEEDGNLFAVYSIPFHKAGSFDIVIDGNALVRTYNIKTAGKINQNISTEADLSRYLKPEKNIESTDPYIVNIAKSIKGSTRKEILENTYKYLQNNMTYKISNSFTGAKNALKKRSGQCIHYAAAMTAILRAKNIPARLAEGYILPANGTHAWVEVYYDEYGWVAYDPTARPIERTIRGADGKIKKVEKIYETSIDEIQYIKSSINRVSHIKFKYSPASRNSSASLTPIASIKKLN